jgi:hypothetical protein
VLGLSDAALSIKVISGGILCLMSQAKPVNERLRELGGTAKLALDILEYDDKLERAFTFICGWVFWSLLRHADP